MIELIEEDITTYEKVEYLEKNGIRQSVYEIVPISSREDGIYSEFIIEADSLENEILSKYMTVIGVSGFSVSKIDNGCIMSKTLTISEYEKFIDELFAFKQVQKLKNDFSNFSNFKNALSEFNIC